MPGSATIFFVIGGELTNPLEQLNGSILEGVGIQ
jgi:hypothetical protein